MDGHAWAGVAAAPARLLPPALLSASLAECCCLPPPDPCLPAHSPQAQAAFPDLARAAGACQRVFSLLDGQPAGDTSSGNDSGGGGGGKGGAGPQQAGAEVELSGAVELRHVAFAYPARPQRLVLKEFSLQVAAGTSCALVRAAWAAARRARCAWGPVARHEPPRHWAAMPPPRPGPAQVGESGSGKSSVLALLERFYDPLDGAVRGGG